MALLATFPGMIYEYEGRGRSFKAFIPPTAYCQAGSVSKYYLQSYAHISTVFHRPIRNTRIDMMASTASLPAMDQHTPASPHSKVMARK